MADTHEATPAPPFPGGDGVSQTPLTVVGLGASAGGLQALQQFFGAVPADSCMAYVVIVHLDPDRESQMAHLIQNRAAIPVAQVTETVRVEPGRAYIIPPGHDLEIADDHIRLSQRGERGKHAPIDFFFRTLADAYGAESVGVVLSGTGSDGTSGLRRIKEAGGITIAQDPYDAEYDSMPRSAIATGHVDLVLPAAEVPAELLRVKRSAPRLPAAVEGAEQAPATGDGATPLRQIFGQLRGRTGHDFSGYKRSTVLRRLDRRLRFNGLDTLEAYVELLRSDAEETDALFQDLLISVSNFFRDPEAFAALESHVVPKLFEVKAPRDAVRVWVPGCATGEEAFSLAMLLCEHAATLAEPPHLQLFATDLGETACARARTALYPETIAEDVSPERLQRFFERENSGYRVKKTLRENVLFAVHNVLKDPPFSRLDLVSCRNLLIYLDAEAQERVLESFHYGLREGGFLFLGTSESVGDSKLFNAADRKQRIYRRSASGHRVIPRLSAPGLRGRTSPAGLAPGKEDRPRDFSYGALHLRMLETYAPPSLIVNREGEVVHLSPRAGEYLRLGGGEPSRKLTELAPGDLGMALRAALYDALTKGESITRHVAAEIADRPAFVELHVRPLEGDGESGGGFALVVFGEPAETEAAISAAPLRPGEGAAVAEVEAELRRLRQQLRSTVQERDATVEELQSANEELQSINEEQKATTEELETGREELQSINEELSTINQEHRGTIDELRQVNADLHNLMEATQIGCLFLDRNLGVRRFTSALTEIFDVPAADPGRPLAHIVSRLNYPELLGDAERVLASLETSERQVRSDTGDWYDIRLHPYRSDEHRIDGVVATFYDITERKRLEEELRDAKADAQEANRVKSVFLATLSHELRTPLNGMLGYADLLLFEERLDAAQIRKVERIKAGVWHLSTMIEEILSFARLDAGHSDIALERVDAREIARAAADICNPGAAGKQLEVSVGLPDRAVELETDRGKARQILVNLLGNAVKYTAAGEIRLELAEESERVVFRIRDTGIGIASADQERIFERFWQVSDGLTRIAGGTGLGLAAAREFSRLLGGDVGVESEPGRGSTFTLWLPRTPPLDATADALTPPRPATPSA